MSTSSVPSRSEVRAYAVKAMMAEEAHQAAYALLVSFGQHAPQWARDAVAAAHADAQAAYAALGRVLEAL